MSSSEVASCGLSSSSSSTMACGPMEQEADEPPEPPEMRSGCEAAPMPMPMPMSVPMPCMPSAITITAAAAAAAIAGAVVSSSHHQHHHRLEASSTDAAIILPVHAVAAAALREEKFAEGCDPQRPDHPAPPRSREREERKEEVEERKVNSEGMMGPLHVGRPEEKKSIVMLATAMLDDSHTPERRIAFNLGKMEMVTDLSNTLRALGHTCRYELVSHNNMDEVLSSIKVHETVFNICDGTDVDGAVGVSLVLKLEQLRIPFSGACSQFYSISSQKSQMKALFEKHMVATMPYRCVEADESHAEALASGPASLSGHLTHLKQWPLFVKPDDAYGSMGISDACVCRNQEELMAQCTALRASGFQRLMVEGFLDGDEYSVLLTDSMTYPSVKKVYLREGALCLDFKADWIDNSYEMVTVKDDVLDARLRTVAMQAYRAVHGNSHARVDLRMHAASGEVCVLEVNSQPGIGDNSTAWDILTGHAARSGQDKHRVAAQFLHQIVTHPRRGQVDLLSTVATMLPSSPPTTAAPTIAPVSAPAPVRSSGMVRSSSNSSSSSMDEDSSSSELSSSPPTCSVASPALSAVHAPDSPTAHHHHHHHRSASSAARAGLLSSSPGSSDSEVYSPTPDPE